MIIFLHGGDTFSSRRKLNEMKDKFINTVDKDSSSLSVLNGQDIALEKLNEKVSTGSLFVKKRLIVIENIFSNKKEKIFTELIDYLKKISKDSDNIIIFWDEELNAKGKALKVNQKKLFTFLGKQQFVQEFKPLTNSQLLSFIKKEFTQYDKDIDMPSATLLINMLGNDLWLLSREIKKISFHNKKEKKVNIEEIKELTTGSFDENVFALTDALSAKNKSLSLQLLEEQRAAGLSEEYLLTMLTRQFKILLQMKEATGSKQADTLAKELKLHPFVVKKGLSQARNFDRENLKKYLNRLIDLDFLNKNGQVDLKTELTLFVSEL